MHNVTRNCNVHAQLSVTFVTFQNEPSKMCTMSQEIATSMPNSLWHSSLFKTNFLKCAHSHKELQRRCPNLCDIRHFWKLYFVQLLGSNWEENFAYAAVSASSGIPPYIILLCVHIYIWLRIDWLLGWLWWAVLRMFREMVPERQREAFTTK